MLLGPNVIKRGPLAWKRFEVQNQTWDNAPYELDKIVLLAVIIKLVIFYR